MLYCFHYQFTALTIVKQHMSKIIIWIIVAIVLIGGGYWFFAAAPSASAPGDEKTAVESGVPTEQPTIENEAAPASAEAPSPATHTVTYTDDGVSPAKLIVKTSDTVVFENKSSRDVWPASAKHPTHTVYPTNGGCLGSTFDACKGLKPGESWSFTFDKTGPWGYHDHLNPRVTGGIIVR